MNKKIPVSLITANETSQCPGISNWPRLTPTGKISHAKTRVYTQRYRKEWEQMPDFKGWLTSVPFQDTRAFCTFCNKNLHAHRLSLLKHTCTMKHQRAALMHQNEMMARKATAAKIAKMEAVYDEVGEVKHLIQAHLDQTGNDREIEDDNEEYEYVVERLEMEDDELNDFQCKREEQDDVDQNEECDDEGAIDTEEDEDNSMPMNNRIKMERESEDCPDALATAMAHVHGEYLDGTDEQVDVEMEMVVTSDDVIDEGEHDDTTNALQDEGDEPRNNDDDNVRHCENERNFLTEEDSSDNIGSESEVSPSGCEREIGDSYEKFSDKSLNSSFANAIPSSSGQSKTFKLSSGKTVTLRPGTQYVLGHVKGTSIPTIVMTDRKPVAQTGTSVKSGQQTVNNGSHKSNPQVVVPCTNQQSTGQPLTKIGTETNKPCISTHVMDTSKGLPVGGLQVSLYKLMDGRWTFLNESNTSASGHCNDLVINSKYNFTAGRYKMHFDVDKYFTLRRIETMYPFIEIVFDVKNPTGNYHIPVLLSPFGYTTYRGADR